MQVRSFTAAGMTEALDLVRAELGDEAVILASRAVPEGVRVTAGLDAPPPPSQPQPQPSGRPDAASSRLLRAHGTLEALAGKLGAGRLAFALSVVLRFQPLDEAALGRPLLFVGPPGGGKTLTVARMATRLVLQGRRPAVMSADARRSGAREQLAAYTGLLGIGLSALEDEGPAPGHDGPLLVDSAGLDPFAAADREEVKNLAGRLDALTVLVLPGGLDAGEAVDLAEGFAACGAARLVATRLDLARRLGGILAAAEKLPLAEAGIGTSASEGLRPMSPALLAACLRRRS